jgi:hypothetical protein
MVLLVARALLLRMLLVLVIRTIVMVVIIMMLVLQDTILPVLASFTSREQTRVSKAENSRSHSGGNTPAAYEVLGLRCGSKMMVIFSNF